MQTKPMSGKYSTCGMRLTFKHYEVGKEGNQIKVWICQN